ncbi:helix-turn-helix domain-containing protein [Martelella radicis]|uniref:AraC-like DNA-binding protein n=1 Tax=Martelella radicis TaxID=1397476 RepID=A0A7W6KLX1_9HYPH|nr:helix-turn-helix domain-containing protein [Martelella radicis]MBB4123658.1 AraC-like DNA-binding protein [Martelella radicis]
MPEETRTGPIGEDLIPRDSFSSTDYGQWREAISQLYVPTRDDAFRRPFRVDMNSFMLGIGTLGRCISVEQPFSRSRAQIGRDGIDNYMVQIFRKGRCHARAPGGDITLDAGDICIFDNTEPLDTVNEDFDLMALAIPRSRLAPLLHDPDGQHYRRVRGDIPLARLFRSHVMDVYRIAPTMKAEDGPQVFSALVHFLAAVINGGRDLTGDQKTLLRKSLMQEVRQHIDNNLDSDKLTVEDISARFGMSRSRLYAHFEPHGGVAAFVRQRRLAAAYQKLTDPLAPQPKINIVATSVGFQSESAFIKAFRRQYGMTPGEAKRQPLVGAALSPNAAASKYIWSDWYTRL